jgi:hypothetical protein
MPAFCEIEMPVLPPVGPDVQVLSQYVTLPGAGVYDVVRLELQSNCQDNSCSEIQEEEEHL